MPSKNLGGRPRGDNPLELPPNVHFKHGALYLVRMVTAAPGTRRRVWLHLGRDTEEALLKAEALSKAKDEQC